MIVYTPYILFQKFRAIDLSRSLFHSVSVFLHFIHHPYARSLFQCYCSCSKALHLQDWLERICWIAHYIVTIYSPYLCVFSPYSLLSLPVFVSIRWFIGDGNRFWRVVGCWSSSRPKSWDVSCGWSRRANLLGESARQRADSLSVGEVMGKYVYL